MPSTADTILPRLEDTSSGKSGGCSGALGGFKTPNSFNFTTSLAVNNSRPPGKLGKMVSMAQKGPTVRNGASCHVTGSTGGLAWLCGTTDFRKQCRAKLHASWDEKVRPPLVCFLTVGSQ